MWMLLQTLQSEKKEVDNKGKKDGKISIKKNVEKERKIIVQCEADI